MTTPQQNPSSRGAQILITIIENWKLILIPVILCTLAAAWYAMKPKTYLASQSLLVRDDMIGESFKPGKFDSLDTMKTAQETILHMAREPFVVRKALEEVGPPKGKGAGWLEGEKGLEAVEDAQADISIVAPNGAEFGKTEVIVLQVKAKTRERAIKLVTALLNATEANLRTMRSKRLASMELELEQSLKLAEQDYRNFAEELGVLEREIGPDLPTLLNMINEGNGSNDFQITLENIRTSTRAAQARVDMTNKQLESLRSTVQNPQELVATSNELLEAQPALRRLKDGLIDLQLKLSDNLGKFQEAHPAISEGRFAISETKRQIHEELQVAIRGLEAQRAVGAQQIDRLNDEGARVQERLAMLTKNRVRYATLASQAKKRNEEHAKARAEYSEIKSLGSAAKTVNLMTRVEEPFVGNKPLGPGRTSILGSGMLGGVLVGLGLIMFFSGPGAMPWIEPPTSGPGENMVRPNDSPRSPAPTSNRPGPSPQQGPASRPPASRPVQVVKQLTSQPRPSKPAPPIQQPEANPTPPFTPTTSQQPTELEASSPPQSEFNVVSAIQSATMLESPVEPFVAEPEPQPFTVKEPPMATLNLQVKESAKPPTPSASPESPQTIQISSSDLKPSPEVTAPPVGETLNTKSRESSQTVELPLETIKDRFPGSAGFKDAEQKDVDEASKETLRATSKTQPRNRKTTKTAPPRTIRQLAPTEPAQVQKTVLLPEAGRPKEPSLVDVDALRAELGAPPLDSPEPAVPEELSQIKKSLIRAAQESKSFSDNDVEEPSENDSIADRIRRLVDPSS
jgi:uncharacterized protein involved in exopolysaccharide biosynthesis